LLKKVETPVFAGHPADQKVIFATNTIKNVEKKLKATLKFLYLKRSFCEIVR